MSKKILKQYREKDKLEVGIDEAGRGCLFGPVCIAGVIWLDEDPNKDIILKDSKKCSEKYKNYVNKTTGNSIIFDNLTDKPKEGGSDNIKNVSISFF